MITLALADDHPLILQGLKTILKSSKEIRVTGIYSNGHELLDAIAEEQPDVLLVDIQMPGISGEELTKAVLSKYPAMKIVALTNLATAYYIRMMFNAGVSGYVLKTDAPQVIVEAVKAVYEGKQYLRPELKEVLLDEALTGGANYKKELRLTKRETEVLRLIAENITSQEIADRLSLSKRTIDHHRNNLLMKLEVKNTAALIKRAIGLNLLK